MNTVDLLESWPSTGSARPPSPAAWSPPARTPAAPATPSPRRCGSASTPPTTPCPASWPGCRAARPTPFFTYVKERAAILNGLADSTMSRDDGWLFLVLGRSLERVDMTARLLSASFGDGTEQAELVTTLRCCSAHEAFLRTYRRRVEPDLVAEFLLLDRLFPRSAFHALELAEECLAQLQPGAGRAGLDDEARRILGRARTDLEFRRVQRAARRPPRPPRVAPGLLLHRRRRPGPPLLPPERAAGMDPRSRRDAARLERPAGRGTRRQRRPWPTQPGAGAR